jgi:hypothetical protein
VVMDHLVRECVQNIHSTGLHSPFGFSPLCSIEFLPENNYSSPNDPILSDIIVSSYDFMPV